MELEHPDITKANKTGYANLVAQPEHCGTDVMDHEILTGTATSSCLTGICY